MKQLLFELDDKLHAKLKIYAIKKGQSIKEILTKYITKLVK